MGDFNNIEERRIDHGAFIMIEIPIILIPFWRKQDYLNWKECDIPSPGLVPRTRKAS